ncbi:MAG: cytochrome c3 family protein [bacterium]
MKKIIFILFFLLICSGIRAEKNKEVEIECALCHIERLTKDNSLIKNQDTISADLKMCYTCHDGSIRDSRNSITAKGHTIAQSSEGEKIYCGTCHRPHEVSKKKSEEPGFFRTPLESLCQSCHTNETDKIAINHIGPDAKGCPTCHTIHNAPETTKAASRPILCLTCHPDKDKLKDTPHNLSGKTTEKSGICGSCHLVHNGNTFMLWANPLDPKKEKNITLLCLTCHDDNKRASTKQIGDIYHPLEIDLIFTPQIKKRLTLSGENTLTCITCHDPHFDKKKFLRMEKVELCAECHPTEKAVIGTKHDLSGNQTKETGACDGCHLVHNASDIKLWARTITPKDDLISSLCYSCHNENDIAKNKLIGNYYHPLNVPILNLNLTSTLPLYTKNGIKLVSGNITCSTCHNVHQWNPLSREADRTSTEEGTGRNSFLRKPSSMSSELCSDCHKKEGFVAKSNHDMTLIVPYSVNIQNNKIEASGICSACHLVHNAVDSTKWAKELPKEGILKDNLCVSCHNKDGMAKNSVIGPNSHPVNKPVADNISIQLPLYNSDGIISRNGIIACLTCHEPHLWDPEYFIKMEMEKTSRQENQAAETEKFTDEQVDSSHIGEVALVQGEYIFIDPEENSAIEIGKVFAIIDDENVIISKAIVEKYNPYAKTFKVFAKILSLENASDIQQGDYVIDDSIFAKTKIVKGTGENSFLRIPNNNSLLCTECHLKKKPIIGTKHDLSTQAPAEQNIQSNNVLESGLCSGCHLAHNGTNVFLSAKLLIKAFNPDPSSGICWTCHVKEGIASNKPIRYEWHHKNDFMPLDKPSIKKPISPLPFFGNNGNVKFDSGTISCGTCHNVHQWDPQNIEIISQGEGDAQNSFLRIKNTANQLCNECHTSPVQKIMTLSSFAAEVDNEEIADFFSDDIPITVDISSLHHNQIVNTPEQTIEGEISDTTITTATLIVNGESFSLEVEEGVFTNEIKLKEGKNTLKITVTSQKGKIAASPLLNITLDSVPLNIASYTYPKPVKISNEFKLKIIFNKTIDTNYPPVIILIGDGYACPFVGKGGEIKTTYQTNDTYITHDIVLDENMAGEITIVVSDARDPAGNTIEKTAEETFILKPEKGFNLDKPDSIIIEEGTTVFSPQINVKFNITDAKEMMITEDVTFKNVQWQTFSPSKTFPLSNYEGEKTIYFKFKDPSGNISVPVTKTCSFILPYGKQNIPRLIDSNLTLTQGNSPYYLRGEITVGRGVVLTIQPGVRLLFSEVKKQIVRNGEKTMGIEKPVLIVEGKLIARGEKDKEIEFNIQSASPKQGDWEGIIIKGAQDNIFEFCRINFANTGIKLDKSKAVIKNSILSKNIIAVAATNNSLLEIASSKIDNNKGEGILLAKSNGNIYKNEIVENKLGIFCDDISNPSIMNNYIMRNEIGILCHGGSSPQIANNTIMENTDIGLKTSFFSSPAIVGNLIAKNKNEAIYVVESSPLIYKNLIRDNKIGISCEKFSRKFLVQNNSIFNNKEFSFHLKNFEADLDVGNNWWGTDKLNSIEFHFYDKNSDEMLGQLIYQPILFAPILSESEGALALTDTIKPKIENVVLPQTLRITPNFRIKIELNESINPYIEPKIYIKNLSGGNNPLILNNNWIFLDGKYSNSVVLTPDIFLDKTMSGKNEVSIENIQDLSGNIIDSAKIGVFKLDTNIEISVTNKKEINIIFNNPQDSQIQVSENASFDGAEWINYTESLPFVLSGHSIYVRFKDDQNNISETEELVINYDDMPPKIINSKIPEDINTLRSFRLKLFFDETLDINYAPKITLIVNNKDKISVSEQGGYFSSEPSPFFNEIYESTAGPSENRLGKNGINNVYFSPNISLKGFLDGLVSFEVENAVDLSGNKMPAASIAGFQYDIMPPGIKSAIIKEGLNTNKKEIHILTNVNKADSIQVSENPSFPEGGWIKYSNNIPFILSPASGQKQVYIRIRDAEGNISKTATLKTNLDLTKPNVISYKYPDPVTLDADFIISVTFDESLDTTIVPEIILISTGTENPIISGEGFFSQSDEETGLKNDTYTTWPIILKSGMGGAITIVLKNASDFAGNIMDITSEETFQLDTFPPSLISFTAEREYINDNKINLTINSEDADFIMLSESETFDTTEDLWQNYIDYTSFSFSAGQGRKNIYLRLKDPIGNISDAFKIEIVVDKTCPQILFYKFQYNPENSSLVISCIFNKSIDTSREPQISFIGSGENTPKVRAGGTFFTDTIQNDTYTPPPIILKEDMTGEIIIVVTGVYDMAGNGISTTTRGSFFYSPIFPVITSIIPMEENFTFTDWSNLYIYAYDAQYMMVSENSSFSNSAWIDFSEKFHLNLPGAPAEKIIYFKFKDAKENISYISNIKIEKAAPPQDFIQNLEKIEILPQDTTTVCEINIKTKFENFTHQMISENPFWEDTEWQPYKSESDFALSPKRGEKTIYLWFRNEIGNYSDILSKKIFLDVPAHVEELPISEVAAGFSLLDTTQPEGFPPTAEQLPQETASLPVETPKKTAWAIKTAFYKSIISKSTNENPPVSPFEKGGFSDVSPFEKGGLKGDLKKKNKQIWTVELASNKDKNRASDFMNKINNADSRNYAYIKKGIINGTICYTVCAGLFNDENDAKSHGEKLKTQFSEISNYKIILK